MSEDDDDPGFLLPLRWKKKRRGNKKFTVADDSTLSKILSSNPRPQPEFKGLEYIREIKNEGDADAKPVFHCIEHGCSAHFNNETSLKCHMNKHLDRTLTCSFCGVVAKSAEERTQHLDEFHPDLEMYPDANPLQCKKCNKISRDKKALWRHVRESHRSQTYPCPHCQFQFSAPDNLKCHLKYKHLPEQVPARKWPCAICGKEYSHKQTLASHIKFNHRGKGGASYRCVLCDTTYDNRITYRRHMKYHINPKFYPCSVCNVQFQNIGHYKRHMDSKRHKQIARRRGKGQPVKQAQKVNDIEIKPNVGHTVEEGQIRKSFTQAELIASCKEKVIKIILIRVDHHVVTKPSTHHSMMASTRRKGYHLNCIYCDLRLPDLKGVKSHEAICLMKIKNKNLHICSHCNKEFDTSYKLANHSKTHSEDRPFKCSYCDSNFKDPRAKVQHEKAVHYGIRWTPKFPRVFHCNHPGCEKQFSESKVLTRHVAVAHLNIRHPCKTCGRDFKRPEQLRQHMKDDHAENPTLLLCKVCKRAYRNKQALLAHYRTKRHQRKSGEMCRQFGNKDEMTETLTGHNSSDIPTITSSYSLNVDPSCTTEETETCIPTMESGTE